ncbi:DUF6518 family protein [Tessaracoccus sp. Z1128]
MHRCLPVALTGSVAAGVAMSFGQTYSPAVLAPLFNSATPVVVLAAGVAAATRGGWAAHALLGASAGPLVMVGYYATTHLRGFPVGLQMMVLWALAGVISGGAMGVAVWLLKGRGPAVMRGVAAAFLPAVALGEAAHGLARISDTTPPAYWWAQAAAGAALLLALALGLLSTWRARFAALAVAVLGARALFVIYGMA